MTDMTIAQSRPVLVAIDISKVRHEVLIAVPGKKRRRRLTVLNQWDAFQRLVATVAEYGRPVCVAFEATGNYHRAAVVCKANDERGVLTHYLPLYFPEADRFHRSSRSDWFFAFLERYPSPHIISAMDKEAFIADAWTAIARRVSKERLLTDICQTAKRSVGLPVEPGSDAITMFRLVLADGRGLIAQRNGIEDRAVALLKDKPDYQLLTSIPGIGPINALSLLAEAGDLRRFGHHRQFLKLCGMELATIQSGLFRGQTKLSKYGNARLRRTLWTACHLAILQRAKGFRDKFERYIAKDRHNTHLRRKANTAIAAKMARTVHAVVKGGEAYRPFFEGAIDSRRPFL